MLGSSGFETYNINRLQAVTDVTVRGGAGNDTVNLSPSFNDLDTVAGDVSIFRRVRVPTSLPFVFSALKVASVLAMIGAIVGEYFGGSQQQLGIVIKNAAALFQFETAWASIIIACLLGIGFYLAVSAVELLVMRWLPSGAGARS